MKSRVLILASQSAGRKALLEELGYQFKVRPSEIDETQQGGELPKDYVLRLAKEKALFQELAPEEIIISADTVVVFKEQILGKPTSIDAAREMLIELSGQVHHVISGYALRAVDQFNYGCDVAEVHMRAYHAGYVDAYLKAFPEALTKAGGYAYQNKTWSFVERIVGEETTVVGLPMPEIISLLKAIGVTPKTR